jgi:hypothetical protein
LYYPLVLSGVFKRGVSPSFFILPPLLGKERGIKGVRLIDAFTKMIDATKL